MIFNDFDNVADELVAVGGSNYKAIVNRTSSRYRDLIGLLGKNEMLAELFVKKFPVEIGDRFTTSYGEELVVVEVRENIDRQITHCLCALKNEDKVRPKIL